MTELGSSHAQQFIGATSLTEPSLFRALSLLPMDEIIGVKEITRALIGADNTAAVRAMFHRLEHTTTYPAYKVGSRWAVSLAAVRAKQWSQERRAFADENQQTLGLIHLLLNNAFPLYADAACGRCDAQQQAQLAIASCETSRLIQKLLTGEAVTA